jgi:hypothetical protein
MSIFCFDKKKARKLKYIYIYNHRIQVLIITWDLNKKVVKNDNSAIKQVSDNFINAIDSSVYSYIVFIISIQPEDHYLGCKPCRTLFTEPRYPSQGYNLNSGPLVVLK